jgi:uncharacterized protein YbjT (DUF2867 family)
VVNCAGVLQDSPREDTEGVHASGAAALFAACEAYGVRRVVHFSAIGVERQQVSPFSATKWRGDLALKDRDLDWVILRPSVVLGRPVFGASALFRGMAALPWLPVMQGTGDLQVVALDDVAATVVFFLDPAAPGQVELDLAGPEPMAMDRVVAAFRAWLGWRPARRVTLPGPVGDLLYRAGDLAGALGWRPPMRTTARKEVARGAVGDPTRWTAMTGIAPKSLAASLELMPATVQERWFAQLYILRPVVLVVIILFWLLTGIISLTNGYSEGVDLMVRAGAGFLAAPGVVAGAVADILVALAIAYRPTTRRGLWAAVGLSIFYFTAGTVLLPELWNDPIGPLLKIWPILVLHLVALAVLEER